MFFFCSCTKYFRILKHYVCYWVGWITYVHWSCVHLHIWYRRLLFCLWCCVLKFMTWFCLQTCVADTRWLKRFLHCLTKKSSPKSRYKKIDRDMSANSSWLFEASLWRLVNVRSISCWTSRFLHMHLCRGSGVARFVVTQDQQSQWPPLTEIMKLKKNNNYFLNFLLFVEII